MANYELVETIALGSDVTSLTFSGIPGDADGLYLRVNARGTSTGQWIYGKVTFNGDTGSNYTTGVISATVAGSLSSTSDNAGIAYFPSGGNATGLFGIAEILLPNYKTADYKACRIQSQISSNSTSTNDWQTVINASAWRNSSVITSITLTWFSAQIGAGSKVSLYKMTNT